MEDIREESEEVKVKKVKALYDYEPQVEDELELQKGAIIEFHKEIEGGWWQGSLNGKIGLFPSNYVEMLEDEEVTQLPEDKSITTNSNADPLFEENKNNEYGTGHDHIFQSGRNNISNRFDRCEEESDNSSVDEELWMVFVGFPSNVQSDQVSECVSKATGAHVNRVAPLNLIPASDSSWIASLQLHNGAVDWSVQNEITVECCGQNCTVQCNPLTPKNIQSTKTNPSDKSDSKEVIYENQFSLKAQVLQSQHLLIQRKPCDNNTTDNQEIPIQLVDVVDIPDDYDDNATLYFLDHKICYKSNWKWDEDKHELCVEAVYFEETEDVLNQNQVTADEFLHNTSQVQETPELCTVEVQGFEPHDAEQCRLYFENSVEGGREEIVLLSVCEDKMYITFKTSKAAEKISGRSHQFISGKYVQVSRLTPLGPVYQNMVLLKNVDKFTKKEHMSMFLENITGLEPQEILQGGQPGIVLVKFEQNIDFDKIKEPCETIMLHGRHLSVSQVPVSNCMLVENLAPGATEKDILEFLNLCMPRDLIDGPSTAVEEEVEEEELMMDENKCFVFFKDGAVIKGMMFDGNTRNYYLVLKHYMKCLGLGGDSGMFTTVTRSLTLTPGDPYKMAYLQQLQAAQDELMIQLRPLHAQLKIVDNSVIVECTLMSSVYMAHGLARTWTYYVHLTFHKYMNQLEVYKLKIIPALWEEIETYVVEINKQNNGDAIFVRLTRQTVIVVGKSFARDLFQGLLKTVRGIEIRRKFRVIHETDKCFKRFQLQLLKTVNFHDIIKIHNNGITVNIYPDIREISFTGFPPDVKMAQIEMIRVLNLVKSCRMADKSRTYRHILSSNQTRELLAKKFSDGNVFAVLDTSEDSIMIYAFSENEITNARRCIQETIEEHVYSLNDVSIHLLSSEEWHDIIQTNMFKNPGKLQISSCEQPHEFLLTGTKDIMDDVIKSIDDFVNENTVYSEEYCLSPSRQKFVTIQWRDKLKSIAASLTKFKVEIFQVKERNEVICVKGTEKGLNLIMRKLQLLGQEITCHMTMVDDPVRVKFFTDEESCKRLDLFERSSKCVVGFSNEPNVLKIVKSNRYDVAGDVCFVGDVKIVSSFQLSEGVTIFLVQGELSHMVVDALVSEINDRMENFKELTRHVASKVSEGEIITSGPEQLLCKQIIYAVSIVYKDGKSGEDNQLSETVLKCLQTAEISGFTSIALPALGSSTHSSNFPLTVCTSVVVKTLKTYVETRSPSNIKAIYLCAHNSDCVEEFSFALQNVLPHNVTNDSKIKNRGSTVFRTSSFWEGSFEYSMHDLRVMIRQADITEENVDAIVNSTNDNLDLNIGAVSRVLKAKCGADLENECRRKVSEMQANGICSTNAFNLKCKIILHVSSRMYHADLEGGVKAILKEADKFDLHSIAFPALGTGFHHVTPEESAKAMFRGLVSFCKGKRETLNEVRVILFDNSTVAPFVSAIQAHIAKLTSGKRGIGKLFKISGKTERTTPGGITMVNTLHQVARLYVYAVDKSDVQILLDDVALVQPSQSVMTDPQKRGITLPVEQNIDGIACQVKSKTLSAVIYMPTFWVDHSPEEKVKKCPLLTSDDEYKNVEKNFRASLRNTKINIVTIERIQNPDLYTHYMIKKNQMESQNADIPGIPNERILWHGTDMKAIPSINHHGFNRSYCGKNATLFGEGVYFAIHSEYSTHPKYSPKDDAGKRYIYQCKVLTGQPTKGEVGLKVLPSRSGVILYDSATNSLDRPTLYVIFNDNQAYPEYLITFTDKE